MTTDWTPPAEAVEAAARAMWKCVGGDCVSPTSPAYMDDARAALAAAYPGIVAEKDAEIEGKRRAIRRSASEREKALRKLEDLEQAIAALCDDDWLRKRDRCMELDGTHGRHSRDAAGAWEHAANDLRHLLGDDYEERVERHDSYTKWLRGDRDRGQAERGEVPVEKRYRGWPTQARTEGAI